MEGNERETEARVCKNGDNVETLLSAPQPTHLSLAFTPMILVTSTSGIFLRSGPQLIGTTTLARCLPPTLLWSVWAASFFHPAVRRLKVSVSSPPAVDWASWLGTRDTCWSLCSCSTQHSSVVSGIFTARYSRYIPSASRTNSSSVPSPFAATHL